jgi:hypothetical protein
VLVRRLLPCLVLLALGCSFQSGSRWDPAMGGAEPTPPVCTAGDVRCSADLLQRCEDAGSGSSWTVTDDCGARGLVCAPTLLACTTCLPDALFCDGQVVTTCSSDGSVKTPHETCDTASGEACRDGGCPNLCAAAAEEKSNVGCEYWGVDLDNAMISATGNAAGQQYAIVVSNPQPDVPVEVSIVQDDGEPGGAAEPLEVANVVIAPLNLRVFALGPREVDGSPDGEFNTGSHTALSRHAYRITSSFPVVAYQFNPLENVNVFSNDASLLKPREALTYDTQAVMLAYVVAGWPQTIAATDDPDTNFNPSAPINLRAFLTIVGTRPDTHVRVRTTTTIVPGGPVAETGPGGTVEQTLDAFDVLNLETGDFNADFTGSLVEADGPIAVFSGSEASDAPHFAKLSERRCCADHLEEQLDPIRTAGKTFAVVHSPSRTQAVRAAGGDLAVTPEPEYVRFVATRQAPTTVTTSLPAPDDVLVLTGIGDWQEVTVYGDFLCTSDQPIHVIQVNASQDAANVPRVSPRLPGGDPSLTVIAPREQYRPDYVFLTPDKYVFDFIMIAAPPTASVLLDDVPLAAQPCEVAPADGLTPEQRGSPDPEMVAYRCQLGFPSIDPATGVVSPGVQHDGVHRIVADAPVGVTVFGFDSYVSYGYTAGTELREIAPPE